MAFDGADLSSVTLRDGAVITYARAGSGPVLVFLHGAMGDYRSWAPQWADFTARFDCIAISCRFSWPNGNTMPAPDHSAFSDARDVVEVLDALGVEAAIAVGSSYGGFASLALAVHYPARIRAVVAVEPPMMKYPEMFEDTARAASRFRDATALPARDAFLRGEDDLGAMLLTEGIQNKSVADIPAPVLERRRQNITAARRISLSSDEFPLLDPKALAAVAVPVMLVTGGNTGPIFRAVISGISRVMRQARVQVVEGAGHSVAQDAPKAFNRLVLGFLGERLWKPVKFERPAFEIDRKRV